MKVIIRKLRDLPEWSKPIVGILALVLAAILSPILIPLLVGYLFFITIFE